MKLATGGAWRRPPVVEGLPFDSNWSHISGYSLTAEMISEIRCAIICTPNVCFYASSKAYHEISSVISDSVLVSNGSFPRKKSVDMKHGTEVTHSYVAKISGTGSRRG